MSEFDIEPAPLDRRVLVGPTPALQTTLQEQGFADAVYRGTDVKTGDEYWHVPDPPISFFFQKKSQRIVVWCIGSDPDYPLNPKRHGA